MQGEPSPLAAPDLAFALGIQCWSYTVHFDKPVSGVTVGLCEMRRQPDGTWLRTQLGSHHGFKNREADTEEVNVSVLLGGQNAKDYTIRLGAGLSRAKLTTVPDFARTYSLPTPARFIEGCLVLAIEEKDPQVMTGREANMVRFIGLSIETK
jgi:hypothetical protein